MSATAKIDFEPGLFEPEPEPAPVLPGPPPFRRVNRAPFVLVGLALLAVTAILYAAIQHKASKTPVAAFLTPTLGNPIPTIQKPPVARSGAFCDGSESLCSTTTTETPAETLAKLAAALPATEGKRYRLAVSVVPLDD